MLDSLLIFRCTPERGLPIVCPQRCVHEGDTHPLKQVVLRARVWKLRLSSASDSHAKGGRSAVVPAQARLYIDKLKCSTHAVTFFERLATYTGHLISVFRKALGKMLRHADIIFNENIDRLILQQAAITLSSSFSLICNNSVATLRDL